MSSPSRALRGLVASCVATLVAASVVAVSGSAARGAATPPAIDASRVDLATWRNIGPSRGGRVVAVTGVPGVPNLFYMAPVDGGVWKTTNAGRTWTPIFDGQTTQSIGAIAVAPSDPATIYVGSGEGLQRPDLSVGDGVYRSTDAGATWTHLGLRDAQQIAKIVVDPHDSKRLYVAALGHPYGPNDERGVYRSTDGGATFSRVLERGPDTGAFDLALAPDGRTLYATLWSARWPPWMAFGSLERADRGAGIYRSRDGGTTWTQLGRGLPGAAAGLGREEIALAPSDPRRAYAAVDAREGGGIYRSDDGGDSWRLANDEPRIVERGDDLASLTVDPAHPDVVYFTNTTTYRSRDGARTFHALKGAPGGDDYHSAWLDKAQPNVVALGSDQGATISVDGGATWSSWYAQPTAQFFHVATDDAFPYRVYGGQQESGSVGIASRGNDGAITFRDWHPVGVEEYGYVAPDPLHPGVIFGGKGQRFDVATGQVRDVSPVIVRGDRYRFDRTAPMQFAHADPHLLYLAANVVFATRDGGTTWRTISPDLTRPHPGLPASLASLDAGSPANAAHRGVVYALGPSYRTASTLWAGTDDGLVWRTADGGATWHDVTPPGVGPWEKITQIDASRFDDDTAYVSVSRFLLDDLRPYVYRTHDAGRTWTRVTDGLPVAPVNAVRADPVRRGLLYAATEVGVSVSFDDGARWQSLSRNLPATSVRDLVVHGSDLVVATHGRSFWILDDVEPLRHVVASVPEAATLYAPPVAVRVRRDTNTDTPIPPDESVGQNPPDGAIFDYALPHDARAVSLEIADAGGQLLRRYTNADVPPVDPPLAIPTYWVRPPVALGTTAGPHRFVWDLHATAPRLAAYDYPISAIPRDTPHDPEGPLAQPGTYVATLDVDGVRVSQPVVVVPDPRVSIAPGALAAQWTFARRIVAAIDASTDAAHRTTGDRRAALDDVAASLAGLLDGVEGADAAPTDVQRGALDALRQPGSGTAREE